MLFKSASHLKMHEKNSYITRKMRGKGFVVMLQLYTLAVIFHLLFVHPEKNILPTINIAKITTTQIFLPKMHHHGFPHCDISKCKVTVT